MPGQQRHTGGTKAMSKSPLLAEVMRSFVQHRGSQEKETDMGAI